MTDFTGVVHTLSLSTGNFGPSTAVLVPNPSIIGYVEAVPGANITTTYFKMVWKDVDCAGPSITFRTWVVTGTPDPTGILYVGSKCGGTAISGAFVGEMWII